MENLKGPAFLILGILLGLGTYTFIEYKQPAPEINLSVTDLVPYQDPSLQEITAFADDTKKEDPGKLSTFEIWCNCYTKSERTAGGGGLPALPYDDDTYTFHRANLTTNLSEKQITHTILNKVKFCPDSRAVLEGGIVRKILVRKFSEEPAPEG